VICEIDSLDPIEERDREKYIEKIAKAKKKKNLREITIGEV